MPRISPLVFAAVICGGLLRPMPAGAGQLLIEEAAYYREQGRQAQAAGRIDEAIEAYRKATLSFPDYVEAYNDLGVAYEAKGDWAQAEATYLAVLRVNPRHAAAHTNLALLYESQGRMDQAVAHWQERVRIGPSWDPWVRQARDHLIQHRASVPEPRDTADLKRQGEIALAYEEGRFDLSHQRWTDAEAAFQRVLALDPDHAGARQGLERARSQAAKVPSSVSSQPTAPAQPLVPPPPPVVSARALPPPPPVVLPPPPAPQPPPAPAPSAAWEAVAIPAPTVRTSSVKVITTPAEARALAGQLAREKEQARSLMVRELYQRGLFLSRQQQYAQAIEQFQRALSIDPNHRESQQSLREAQAALAHSQR